MGKDKYKILINASWIVLLICLMTKMFGHGLFVIICENQNFIDACNWLDGSWVKYIIATLFYEFSTYLIYLTIMEKKIGDDWWLLIAMLPVSFIKSIVGAWGIILDLIFMVLIPLIVGKFKNWKNVLVANLLVIFFQAVSLVTKELGLYLTSESMLVSIIVSIDYYLLILLYYLDNRERRCE